MKKKRVHIEINGKVQGVFFRAGTQEVAMRNGVSGWVRNTCNGSVEAVLEGSAEPLKRVIEWCRKGPPGAVVSGIDISWEDYTGEFTGFTIRR